MDSSQILEHTPFDLKRKGDFEGALRAYAEEYKRTVDQQGSRYIARLCFEQMIDILLLKYLRDNRSFEKPKSLANALEAEMIKLLRQMDVSDIEGFREYFDRSRRKLFPRGRGKSAFSVDRKLLLRTSEYQEQRVPTSVREEKTDYTV